MNADKRRWIEIILTLETQKTRRRGEKRNSDHRDCS